MKRYLPYVGLLFFGVAVANVVWSLAEGLLVGDALGGRERDGHFYVFVKPEYREVTEATWNWLRFHETSVLVSMPIASAALFWFLTSTYFPRQIAGWATPETRLARVVAVRGSGPPLLQSRGGIRVDRFQATWPLSTVWVHPVGVVFKVAFMTEHSILASEVRGVRSRWALFGAGIEIEHKGVDCKSPVLLYTRKNDRALATIWRAMQPNDTSLAHASDGDRRATTESIGEMT